MRPKNRKKMIKSIILGFKISAVLFSVAIVLSVTIPYAYGAVAGDTVTSDLLEDLGAEGKTSEQLAVDLISWQRENFESPYFHDPVYSVITATAYNIKDAWRVYFPLSPPTWTITSGLGNCGEYARVFAHVMEESGTNSWILSAPGDDHAWAAYATDHGQVPVDPSAGRVISDRKSFGDRKNLSYVVRTTLDGERSEVVTSQYVDVGRISVNVTGIDNPVIQVQDPSLARQQPEKYSSPRKVFEKQGKAVSFELGPGEYIISVEDRFMIFERSYTKQVEVEAGEDRGISFTGQPKSASISLVDLDELLA